MRILGAVTLLLAVTACAVPQEPARTNSPAPTAPVERAAATDPAKSAEASKAAPAPAYPLPKAGDYWYAVHRADGAAAGYAKMTIAAPKEGGLIVKRDLHVVHEGNAYEEERSAAFDSDLELSSVEFASGSRRLAAKREGRLMIGTSDGEDLKVEVEGRALTGLAYVFAGCMTRESGKQRRYTQFNEAHSLYRIGAVVFKVAGLNKIQSVDGEVLAWKITMSHTDTFVDVWVSEGGEIVQADFDGQWIHKLHRQPTTHLFKPEPPVYTNMEPDNLRQLVLEAEFPGFTVEEMFDHWTKPDLLTKWWPPKAEIDAKVGSKYTLSWPNAKGEMTYQLAATITEHEQNKRFGFTWDWKGEENPNKSKVSIQFSETKDGVKLRVTHGPYTESEGDQEHRKSQLEGWQFFGAKLKALKKK